MPAKLMCRWHLTSCWMTSSQRWSRVPLPLSSCLSYKACVMRFWYKTRLAWNLRNITTSLPVKPLRIFKVQNQSKPCKSHDKEQCVDLSLLSIYSLQRYAHDTFTCVCSNFLQQKNRDRNSSWLSKILIAGFLMLETFNGLKESTSNGKLWHQQFHCLFFIFKKDEVLDAKSTYVKYIFAI